MADILFATLAAGGNLPPALGIAAELLQQGHRVRFLGHAEQAAAVEGTGAEFIPYRHAAPLHPAEAVAAPRQFAAMLRVFGDEGIGRDLVAEAGRGPADAVVVDCLLLGAIRAAARAGLPTAVLVHSFLGFFDGPFRRGPMGAALALKGLPARRVMSSAGRILVCADPLLDPAAGAHLPAGRPSTVWTGAVVEGAAREMPAAQPPRVLASLSTTAFPGQGQVLQRILDAAATLPLELVVTTGPAVNPAALNAPRNATVLRYVDHAELMPGCSAVIGHGGHSTTMRALAQGLPMLVLPMHPLMDQPMVGKAVRDAGAGLVLSRKSRSSEIAEALTSVLGSDGYAAAAARVGERLRGAAGAKTGARAVLDFARESAKG